MDSRAEPKGKSFFARYAVAILIAVFFLVPFAVRGARMSLLQMQNDVKDWLPKSFAETAEMDWFWERFKGERFVLASWEDCRAEDPSFKLFLKKLAVDKPPSQRASEKPIEAKKAGTKGRSPDSEAARIAKSLEIAEAPAEAAAAIAKSEKPGGHTTRLEREQAFIGDELRLFHSGDEHFNWGGRQEKWLQGKDHAWYFLTPEGDLFRWTGGTGPIESAARLAWKSVANYQVEGELVAAFSPEDAAWYYENPRRLCAQLFRTVTTGPELLAELTKPGGALAGDEEEAHRRLNGLLFGADGKQTCLLITLTESGLADLHQVAGRGLLGKPRGRLFEIADECGISQDALHLGGPPIDNVAIDEEGTITLVRLVSLCAVLGLGLAYVCFRSVIATCIIFFIGGMAAILSLALVGWSGATLDAILMSMPALVYVLGISGAVHLINYYREAVEESGYAGAAGKAVAHGWKPAVLCSITTALGLFSLCTSEIAPIAKFGVFSGIGVLATNILLFTFLPAALEFLPIKFRQAKRETSRVESSLAGFWDWFGRGIMRYHYAVAAGCMLVVIVVGWGVTRIDTSINLLELFDPEAKTLKDYAWLEGNLGKLVPMEVVVSFPKESLGSNRDAESTEGATKKGEGGENITFSFLERMEVIEQIQRTIDQEYGPGGRNVAGPSMSALTFAPSVPAVDGDRLTNLRRSATNNRLEENRDAFLRSDFMRIDPANQAELWRISLRIAALQNVDYGQFVNQVKTATEPIIAAQYYREQILKALVKERGGRYAGGYVCLLADPADVSEPEDPEAAAELLAKRGLSLPVDQTKIFANTLERLLAASFVDVKWLDPAELKTAEQAAELEEFDCVAQISGAVTAQAKNQAKSFVDAREHEHQIAENAPAGAEAKWVASAKASTPRIVQGGQRVSAVYTGVAPIVYKAQRTLLNSLIQSTFWSFVTITPLMMFLARGPRAGLVAMLPNALPVLVIFGSMGWMGVRVDIGSMMTASIALGVAVDDTIHFLTWFRWELNKTADRRKAILAAYSRCATPTLQTALISGLGLSIFVLSTFTPTQRFGYLMLTILLAGVVAELVFFPALLAGPLGRYFKPGKQKPKDAEEQPTLAVAGASAPNPTTPAPHFHRQHGVTEKKPAMYD